jgi:propionyl-CoA carboxylase alpha chain
VKYQSAGTVEFVVGKDQGFYFLEMNTRLQVEHPVTECITGLDLVELMIRVAAGERLMHRQDELRREAGRSSAASTPRTRSATSCPPPAAWCAFSRRPPTCTRARPAGPAACAWTPACFEGGEIPMFYDSMIAKLIVHGKDRNDAMARMREALNGFVIRGISQQHPFPGGAAGAPRLCERRLQHRLHRRALWQGLLGRRFGTHDDVDFLVALAAFVRRKTRERAVGISGQLPGHEVMDWTTRWSPSPTWARATPAPARSCHRDPRAPGVARCEVDGKAYDIECQFPAAGRAPDRHGQRPPFHRAGGARHAAQSAGLPRVPRRSDGRDHGAARAPCRVACADALQGPARYLGLPAVAHARPAGSAGGAGVGQKVQAGERLAVIEAMKMENVLFAVADGVVGKVLAQKGESLSVDQPIVEFA